MALGGVLRAALKAGDWARAAAQSRRQARALRSFSPEFGSGRGTSAEEFLRSRGVDVEGMLAPGTGNPYMDWVADFDGPRGYYADSPFGGVVQGSVRDGVERRFRPAPEMYSPIVAPYEGGRAWGGYRLPFDERVEVGVMPGGFATARAGTPFSMSVPEWMGRGAGPAPSVGRFASRDMSTGGGRLYDDILGERQGLPFYAPNVPVPLRDSFYGYF